MNGFNMTPLNTNLIDLISDYELQTLLCRPKCFKNTEPSCINYFLITRKFHFIKT